MTRFRPEGRKYYKTGVSGYIGAGNNPMVYSQSPSASFARLKQLYGDHLENYHHVHKISKSEKEISEEVKRNIRKQVKKEIRATYRKRTIALIISTAIVTGFIFAVYYLLLHFFPSLG
ncbi:hypothetical protein [Saccharicrinis sp. FJH54]|uniref:hypothetical protein n=1 Tax=Saccharicrinis sp. FJH54 TaxID=3344665 RepID=UPI0035D3FE3B